MKKRFIIYVLIAIASVIAINSLILTAVFQSNLASLGIADTSHTMNKITNMIVILDILLLFYSFFLISFSFDKLFDTFYTKDITIDKIRNKAVKDMLPLEIKMLEQVDFIEKKEREYKKEKRQIQLAIQNMSEGLIIVGTDQKILYLNNKARELLRERDDASYNGQYFLNFSRNKEYAEAVKTALDGETYSNTVTINNRKMQFKSNAVFYHKEMVAVFCLISDKTIEYERDRHKIEFTSNVSHELKTPLTSILGYADLISQGIATPEDTVKFADNITHQSKILLNMINDIIKLSQIESTEKIERKQVNFSNIIKNSIKDMDILCKEKDISMSLDIDENIVFFADEKMMVDLVNNLINNAIKYNKQSGLIYIKAFTDKGMVHFEVKDTGIGIPKDKQEKVFERFYTVDDSRYKKTGGTGLGLSIVKHIVIAHNGKISLKSEENVGSTFKVVFIQNPFE